MDLRDSEGGHESLQTRARIWNHLFSFIKSMSLKCAVDLRIPDAIHKHGGQPVTLSQLVQELGIPPGKAAFVCRLMRLLTHSGFFTVQSNGDAEEGYLLTNLSQHLLRDNPHSAAPLIIFELNPLIMAPWQSLSSWFRGDSSTPFQHLHGESIWEVAARTPGLNELINNGLASDSRLTVEVAITEHGEVFRELKSLVDVGGGSGAVAVALAKAFPHLKCSVLDLPHVVASATKSAAVDFVAGNMFEYVPPADAILLKRVLHDWSDEHCVKVLKLCKDAIPPKEEGGKVIIMEMVVSEDDLHHLETQYFFDMLMLVHSDGGKERNEAEWGKLFMDAGFSGYKITTLGLGLPAIIEVYR